MLAVSSKRDVEAEKIMQHSCGVSARTRSAIAGLGQQGITNWLIGRFRTWRGLRVAAPSRLQLIETLRLDGKTNLMLVSCDGDHFLVGCGRESVQAITQVQSSRSLGLVTKNQDALWE